MPSLTYIGSPAQTGLAVEARLIDATRAVVGSVAMMESLQVPGTYYGASLAAWGTVDGWVQYVDVATGDVLPGGEVPWNPARLAPDGLDAVEHPAMQYPGGHVVIDRTAGELRVYDADPATGGVLLYTRAISETATTTTLGAAT